MLIPLFTVIILELAGSLHSLTEFIIQEYRRAHDLPLPAGIEHFCPASSLLTPLVLLILCSYKFFFAKRVSDKREKAGTAK